MSGVLRLSSKYFVEHLRERCMIRLHHDWLTTLAGWDQHELEAVDPTGHSTFDKLPTTFRAQLERLAAPSSILFGAGQISFRNFRERHREGQSPQ
jgi:hypothetical protein